MSTDTQCRSGYREPMDTATPTDATPTDAIGPPDRRARNRARTRRALIDAAIEWFAAEGFGAVSVERIADAAGVSPRTFFRYFPTKEDVVFADYEAEFDAWDEVTATPQPGEPLLETIRRGAHRVVADYEADPERWDRWFALVVAEPALQRRMLESQARLRARATVALARLLGVDSATDPRPAALASAAMAATEAASRAWYAAGKPRPRREAIDEALDALTELSDLLAAPSADPSPPSSLPSSPSYGRDRHGAGREGGH
jgi:AcrR family transcriptional regulator